MAYLVDTNVLGRLANTSDAQHGVASQAVVELHRQGQILHLTPQVLIEFRSIATRLKALNGLGLSAAQAAAQSSIFEATFPLLPDTPDIYPAWKAIVAPLGVVGKQVHDARLVAVCHAHGVSHLLTFNVTHFTRFAACGPGVTIIDATSL
jgi:predicted nucleic acid-binding protein